MTIVAFLKARIAEDEAAESRKYKIHETKLQDAFGECTLTFIGQDMVSVTSRETGTEFVMYAHEFYGLYTEPAPNRRMLAECAAKRALLDFEETMIRVGAPLGVIVAADHCLKVAAAVYAGHPDYNEGWRP